MVKYSGASVHTGRDPLACSVQAAFVASTELLISPPPSGTVQQLKPYDGRRFKAAVRYSTRSIPIHQKQNPPKSDAEKKTRIISQSGKKVWCCRKIFVTAGDKKGGDGK